MTHILRAPRSSGLGALRLDATGRGLVRLEILQQSGSSRSPSRLWSQVTGGGSPQARHVLTLAVSQLQAYLAGRRGAFTCPVDLRGLEGSPFQHRVWRVLREIPFGATRTYGEVARRLGRPGAARAVGMACHRNPVAIVIPCHRVIGHDGRLTGYSAGLAMKKRLLRLERRRMLSQG